MYGREYQGRVLDFGHEGALYRRSFVMYDKQTESLWLHVTGEALKGELKGARLPFLPSEVVSWGEWRARYPYTKVLLGEKEEGFMGTFSVDSKFEQFGLSVGAGRDVVLFPYPLLRRMPVLNDHVGPSSVVITFDAARRRGAAWSREADGRTLHFDVILPVTEDGAEDDGPPPRLFMRDLETGSIWDLLLGECVSGALTGTTLERVVSTPWLAERWLGFFPDGEVVTLPGGIGIQDDPGDGED